MLVNDALRRLGMKHIKVDAEPDRAPLTLEAVEKELGITTVDDDDVLQEEQEADDGE